MFEELKEIELSGKKYPIKCDLVVLEKAQEPYGSIEKFEAGLITWEPELDENGEPVTEEADGEEKRKYHGKFPKAKAVIDGLWWMACEGEAITAEKEGRTPATITREGIARKADLSLITLANQLHDEFYRCFNSKNGKTTQIPKEIETP